MAHVAGTTALKYERRWWTLGVLVLSLVIIGLDNTILNVAIPTLQREFNASASTLQWMVDSYVLVYAGLLLMNGSLGDRYGRKAALQVGLVLFGVSSFGAAFSQTSGQLIAARAIMGIGGAAIMPATLSIITDVFPGEERGRAIGIWAAAAGIGIGLGPLIGGVLLQNFWWGSVFLVNVPVVIAALAIGVVLVPDSRDPEPAAPDVLGTVFSVAAVSLFVYGIIEAPARGWTDGAVAGALVLGIAFGAAFAFRETRTDHPMLDFEFFRHPRFSGGAGAISAAFFALFGMIFGLTQYLQFVQGYSPLGAGIRTAPVAVGMMLGAGLSDRFVRRFGTTRVVAAGLVGVAVVLASFNATLKPDTAYPVVAITMILMTFALGNVMAPSTDAVMGAVPATKAGVASAMNDVTRQVGGALGVAVIGSVLHSLYSSRMLEATSALPAPAAAAANDSVGAAIHIAAGLPAPAAAALASAARSAFSEAMGLSVLIGTAILITAAAGIALWMPSVHASDASSLTVDTRPAV